MKTLLQILLVCLIPATLAAQPRVDYLDRMLNVVEETESAFVREITQNADGTYDVVVKFRSGEVKMKGKYLDSSLETEEGIFEYYFANGVKESEGKYDNGVKKGTWKRWDVEGNPRPDRYYPEMTGDSETTGAKFPGGDQSLIAYLNSNLVYPEDAKKSNQGGIVYVAFQIGGNGEISQVEIFQGVTTSLDNEAKRLVSSMPQWIPATRNGSSRESKFILPITFDPQQNNHSAQH